MSHSKRQIWNSLWLYFSLFHINIFNLLQAQTDQSVIISETACGGILGQNFFFQGDFGRGASNILPGDPGYAPGYQYELKGPPDNGQYTITNSTTPWGHFADFWINIKDNSPDPLGYMMIVNANEAPGILFEQLVDVCATTRYEFGFDLISMNIPGQANHVARPNINVLINGISVFGTGDIPVDSSWHTYKISFMTLPGTRQLELSLQNNTPAGHALAIDNIYFRACRTSTIHVTRSCTDQKQILTAIHDLLPGSNPDFIWQSSMDGKGWNDFRIGKESTLVLDEPIQGTYYRYKVAGSPENFSISGCHLISEVYQVSIQQDISIDIHKSICPGDTFLIGNRILAAPGTYRIPLKSVGGCDSILMVELNFFPVISDTQQIILCRGLSYNGTPYYKDTLLEEKNISSKGCDSIKFIRIQTVLPGKDTTIIREVCAGYIYQGVPITKDSTIIQRERSVAGCDSLVILFLKLIPDPIVKIQGDTLICNSSPQMLTVPGFKRYQWSTGDTSTFIEVNNPMAYSVTVSDHRGCQAMSSIIIKNAMPRATLSYTSPLCFGGADGNIKLKGVEGGLAPYLFKLNDGPYQSDSTFHNLVSGTYHLIIRDNNFCETSQSLLLASPPAFTALIETLEKKDKNEIVLKAIFSIPPIDYHWHPSNGLSCTVCVDPIASITGTRWYYLTAENQYGCILRDSIQLFFNNPNPLFIPNVFTPNGDGQNDFFTLYPSPDVKTIRSLFIFDRWGNTVYAIDQVSHWSDVQWDGRLHHKELAAGVYVFFLSIEFFSGETRRYKGDIMLIR